MRIILNEMRKIFNLKTILIIVIGSGLLFKIFPSFYIEYFPNGQPTTQILELIKEMRTMYGDTLDKKEEQEVLNKLFKEKEREVDKYIQNDKEAQSLGITNYKQLEKSLYLENVTEKDQQIQKIHDRMIFEEDSKEFWNMEAIESLNDDFKEREVRGEEYKYDLKKLERYKEVSNREEQPLIDEYLMSNFDHYILGLSVIVIFAVMVLLGTIFVRDRINKVEYLQLTSKVGREMSRKKLIAGILSTVIVVGAIVGIGILVYFSVCGTTEFFNTNINGMFSRTYRFDITYLQYVIIKVTILCVLSIGVAAITMAVSKTSKSYLKVLCEGIPIFVVLKFGIGEIILNNILTLHKNESAVGWLILMLCLTALFCINLFVKRKVDIVY